jgi:tetratricopeptide (TPR) repeat protein
MLAAMAGVDPELKPRSRPVALTSLIGAHLEKVLGSSVFKTADSLRELLRFTVHETMAGRGDELKEYVLAVTVLGKGDSFDPKADSIVRAQMRRLREHLGRYYATEGRHDQVVIDIPRGTYMPTFRRTTPEGVVAVPPGAEERVIVGRQQELTDLRSAFESAAAGDGRLVCVSGEPGIGKTTVVESFFRELSMSGTACYLARGRCSERLAGSEAYLPVLEALETLLREGDDSVRQLMSVVAPTWCAQIAPAADDNAAGRKPAEGRAPSQERLKREFVAFLNELASRQPVVLFLDDLHWADASTVDILAYAAARCASRRMLIVAAYRPAELFATDHPFLRVKLELTGHGICCELAMPFLTRADVDRYLDVRFPAHLFPPQLSTRIHDRTEGNPLFMADLARFLRDRGVLAEDDGRWVMIGQLPEVERELPESVRSMVEKKISQLGDDDCRLLVVASVQGYGFDSAVVSTALGMNAAEVEERLDVLERVHGFVKFVGDKEFPDRDLTMAYRFVHVLYQNALFASLRPTRKASLSAAVAEALLAHHGTQPAAIASELAMLFEAARDFGRAAEYFLLAAKQAARVSANREVIVLARRGIAALTMLPETPERARQELRLQTTLGPALMAIAGIGAPEVQAVYVRAQSLCQQVGETPQRFTVLFGLYQYWIARGDYQTCRELAEQLLALAQKLEDPAFLLLAHNSLANTLWLTGDIARSVAHNEQSMAIYVPRQHHALAALYSGWDPGVACLAGGAKSLWILGYPDRAIQRGDEAIALARQLDHAYSEVPAQVFNAVLHQHRRDAPRTRQHAEAAIALATEQELATWLPWAAALRGRALVELGQADEGIAHAARSHYPMEERDRGMPRAVLPGPAGRRVRDDGPNRASAHRARRGARRHPAGSRRLHGAGAVSAQRRTTAGTRTRRSLLSSSPRDCVSAGREIIRAPSRDELESPSSQARQARRGPADAGGDLRLVHRRVRHGGFERGPRAAREFRR